MKLRHLILFCLLTVCQISCNKLLHKKPTGYVPPEQNYATEAQLISALAGVYDVLGLNSSELYADAIFSKLGACTDEGYYARSTMISGPQVYNFDYTNADIGQFWTTLYTGIERANNLIYYIHTPQNMDKEQRNAILGEAKFLRGYFYFLLVSNFGDVPLRLLPTTLTGVGSVNVPRIPASDIYAQILKDMGEAETLCYPATHFNSPSRVSQSTVEGILARVCLTMAGYPLSDKSKYETALFWAKKVKASGIHSLNPNYQQVFVNLIQNIYAIKECLWEADFLGPKSATNLKMGRLGNTNGIACSSLDTGYSYGFINVTAKLYNLYGAGDLRRDWAIAPYSYSGINRVAHGSVLYDRNCGKWRRSYETDLPKDKNITGENFPILRYSDVLLMLAEAENQVNGPTTMAYDAINQVRRRAYGKPTSTKNTAADLPAGLSQSAFQKFIEDERARELCFEALRRPDLIRWGLWTKTMAALADQMTEDVQSNPSIRYCTLGASNAVSAKYLLYPIPQAEISINKLARQNPGY